MCFLYILPRLRKNVFKRILQRFVRISFGSGCVWHWFDASADIPGRLCCWLSAWLWFTRSCRTVWLLWTPGGGLFLIGRRLLGWGESTKKMYDKSETASKPGRFEPEKSEKNRRNLRLIQTCDFFILCILYIIPYNVPRRDVNFYFIAFNSSFLAVFFLLAISKILLLRFFCRLVSLFLRFAGSLLTVPMPTPFRTFLSCSDSVN